MSASTCVVCERPTPDGYACVAETERARAQLAEIVDLVPAARAVAHRQTSGEPVALGAFGPVDLLDYPAGARLDAVQNALTGWGRAIAEERGVGVAAQGEDMIAVAARYVAGNLEWCRHKAWVEELLREVNDCLYAIRSVVTRHREPDEIVGACECGRILYARAGREFVTCPGCAIIWDVGLAREELRDQLHEQFVTAAEAAHLGAYLDTERTSEQVRKLVNKWASRGRLIERGLNGGDPTYRFGDIADLIAASPRKISEPAEMGA